MVIPATTFDCFGQLSAVVPGSTGPSDDHCAVPSTVMSPMTGENSGLVAPVVPATTTTCPTLRPGNPAKSGNTTVPSETAVLRTVYQDRSLTIGAPASASLMMIDSSPARGSVLEPIIGCKSAVTTNITRSVRPRPVLHWTISPVRTSHGSTCMVVFLYHGEMLMGCGSPLLSFA